MAHDRRADVSDDEAVAALASEAGETFGRLDALVNNAGMTGETIVIDGGYAATT